MENFRIRGYRRGSVLGPLLYSVYVNDMTEAVRKMDCQDPSHNNNDDLFGQAVSKVRTNYNVCGRCNVPGGQ